MSHAPLDQLGKIDGQTFSAGNLTVTNDAIAGLKSDYNFLDPRFEIDGAGGKTLAQWRTATGGDGHSLAINLAQMQALFSDYANNNFAPDCNLIDPLATQAAAGHQKAHPDQLRQQRGHASVNAHAAQ